MLKTMRTHHHCVLKKEIQRFGCIPDFCLADDTGAVALAAVVDVDDDDNDIKYEYFEMMQYFSSHRNTIG